MVTDLNEFAKFLESRIGEFGEDVFEFFQKELLRIFKEKAVPAMKERLLAAYDELASLEESATPPAIKGKDFLSLETLRPIFIRQLDNEVDVKIQRGFLTIEALSRVSMGFGREPSSGFPETVDTLAYYIDGITGDFAFISEEQYKKGRRDASGNLGRLGNGFMMSRDDYLRERWGAITGLSFQQVRHPISVLRPYSGFDTALNDIDFGSYIVEVADITAKTFNRTSI